MTENPAVFFDLCEKNPHNLTGITLSKPVLGKTSFLRITIRQIQNKNGTVFYTEEFTETQTFHKNLSARELNAYICQCAGVFRQLYAETTSETFTLLFSKKGNRTLIKKPKKSAVGVSFAKGTNSATAKNSAITENAAENQNLSGAENSAVTDNSGSLTGQNRVKKYLLPEGIPVPFLVKLGVMNDEGIVFTQKYAKFRQINRFLEFIDDILEPLLNDENAGQKKQTLSIIDYGCGKSYLTFAVHHFLHQKGITASITGLDLKKDVVDFCNTIAADGFDGLRFYCGDIASYRELFPAEQNSTPPDLVISLHACDTATDHALAQAISLGARAILAVPCCQHELKASLKASNAAPEFAALLRHGIVKERFAALVTDVMRAELLENTGYTVQILEFIESEHTPKNLLIRAVKKSSHKKSDLSAHYTKLRDALKTVPLLENLL